MTRITLSRVILSVTAAAVLAGGLIVGRPEPVEAVATPPKPTIMVIGDSITARYNDIPGHANRGWWSFVGESLGANMTTWAESGTGILARGGAKYCKLMDKNPLTTHGYRTKRALRWYKFDGLIVEVGANDWRRCKTVTEKKKVVTKVKRKVKVTTKGKNGKKVTKTVTKMVNKVTYKNVKVGKVVKNNNATIRKGVKAYIAELKVEAKAAGLPLTQIVFVYPRGPERLADRDRVARIYADEVKKAGLYWVNVGVSPKDHTVDGTHPNLAGNKSISGWFMLNLPREAPKFKAQVIDRPNWTRR